MREKDGRIGEKQGPEGSTVGQDKAKRDSSTLGRCFSSPLYLGEDMVKSCTGWAKVDKVLVYNVKRTSKFMRS